MQHPRRRAVLAIGLAAAAALTACGSDDDSADSTPGSSPAGAVSLADVCPETINIQTDWYPEAEHGFLYNLMGEDYTIDKDDVTVTAPLVFEGQDTGVEIQVRSGGPAIGSLSVSEQMYTDDTILLGYVYTDEAIQYSTKFPTVAIEAGFEKNPQMIMWDPATYPDVEKIADLKATGAIIRYFAGRAYMDYFANSGILDEAQLDSSYTGGTDPFTGDEGKAAQQGFGSAEPYIYEHEVDAWMKPVKYDYVNDAGWEAYAQSIATRPDNITEFADCFEQLVPMIQQSSIDYLDKPELADEIILDAVKTFDTFWVYDQQVADYGKQTIKDDGLVANGPDDTLGNFDLDRVNGLIEIAVPIYANSTTPPKAGLKAEDIVTNEFIDPSIGF